MNKMSLKYIQRWVPGHLILTMTLLPHNNDAKVSPGEDHSAQIYWIRFTDSMHGEKAMQRNCAMSFAKRKKESIFCKI